MRSHLLLGTALAGAALFAAEPASAQWYARLDSGYAWARDANFQDNFPDQLNGTFVIGKEESRPGQIHEIGSAWLIDGGIGFRFNRWLRTDMTVGYRGGYELDDIPEEIEFFEAVQSGGPQSFTGDIFAEISSIPVLLNAYIDLGGVTPGLGQNIVPYVGAGFGFARNEIEDIQGVDPRSPGRFTARGGSNVDLAWAVMAGFSAPISGVRNLFLDVGYRYLDSGKIETEGGLIIGAEGAGGIPRSSVHNGFNGDLTAHEFKAGMRLMLP